MLGESFRQQGSMLRLNGPLLLCVPLGYCLTRFQKLNPRISESSDGYYPKLGCDLLVAIITCLLDSTILISSTPFSCRADY